MLHSFSVTFPLVRMLLGLVLCWCIGADRSMTSATVTPCSPMNAGPSSTTLTPNTTSTTVKTMRSPAAVSTRTRAHILLVCYYSFSHSLTLLSFLLWSTARNNKCERFICECDRKVECCARSKLIKGFLTLSFVSYLVSFSLHYLLIQNICAVHSQEQEYFTEWHLAISVPKATTHPPPTDYTAL